jgi:uncharacterized protein YbcC (UPF0753/DUF2309 family)
MIGWETRDPEWGLSIWKVNKHTNLDGRFFIPTTGKQMSLAKYSGHHAGPMVVTQWINNHYIFFRC